MVFLYQQHDGLRIAQDVQHLQESTLRLESTTTIGFTGGLLHTDTETHCNVVTIYIAPDTKRVGDRP